MKIDAFYPSLHKILIVVVIFYIAVSVEYALDRDNEWRTRGVPFAFEKSRFCLEDDCHSFSWLALLADAVIFYLVLAPLVWAVEDRIRERVQ